MKRYRTVVNLVKKSKEPYSDNKLPTKITKPNMSSLTKDTKSKSLGMK